MGEANPPASDSSTDWAPRYQQVQYHHQEKLKYTATLLSSHGNYSLPSRMPLLYDSAVICCTSFTFHVWFKPETALYGKSQGWLGDKSPTSRDISPVQGFLTLKSDNFQIICKKIEQIWTEKKSHLYFHIKITYYAKCKKQRTAVGAVAALAYRINQRCFMLYQGSADTLKSCLCSLLLFCNYGSD